MLLWNRKSKIRKTECLRFVCPDYLLIDMDSARDTSVPRWTSCSCSSDFNSYIFGRIISIGYWSAHPAYKVTTFSTSGPSFLKFSVAFFHFSKHVWFRTRDLLRHPPCAAELPDEFEQSFLIGKPWFFSEHEFLPEQCILS